MEVYCKNCEFYEDFYARRRLESCCNHPSNFSATDYMGDRHYLKHPSVLNQNKDCIHFVQKISTWQKFKNKISEILTCRC